MVYNIPHSKPVAFYVFNIKSKVETYSKQIFSFLATTLLSLLFNVHFFFFLNDTKQQWENRFDTVKKGFFISQVYSIYIEFIKASE